MWATRMKEWGGKECVISVGLNGRGEEGWWTILEQRMSIWCGLRGEKNGRKGVCDK